MDPSNKSSPSVNQIAKKIDFKNENETKNSLFTSNRKSSFYLTPSSAGMKTPNCFDAKEFEND